jgi:hypothetical protein
MSKSNSNQFLLTIAVILCISYSGYRAIKFAISRVPPYREGTCLQFTEGKDPTGLTFQIKKNHILQGYSDISVTSLFFEDNLVETFEAQREESGIAITPCQEKGQ